jgi:hypothetical protein
MAVTVVSRRRDVAGSRRRLADDVRSLGAGAPVRALYEISKRTGGHRLVLQRMAAAHRRAPARLRANRALPARDSIDPSSVERTLAAADQIASGRLRVFGRVVEVGSPPRWHAVIDGPGEWPRQPWWDIDIRSTRRLGDVKWAWEIGRHRHLVILARAVHLEPDRARWATTLQEWLRSWVDENPLEVGVHWASNLELALRALAWSEVIAFAGDHLDTDLTDELGAHLWHTGHHLVAELPYTVSTTPNNHLLGDALGLLVVGSSFDHRTAERWQRLGGWLFERQAARQFRSDGSSIDDALSYDRFTAEMLVARTLVPPAPGPRHLGRVRAAAGHLARLGVFDGPVPQYGDWDEGRVLTSVGDALDLRGSAAALAEVVERSPLGGGDEGRDPHRHQPFDEVAWYAPPAAGSVAPTGAGAGTDDDGEAPTSIARADRGPFRAWLRAGTRRWHGHADLLSCEMTVDGAWAVVDPGTGTYNGDPAVRDGLRTSTAHAVLRLDGTDQLVPHRVFRWRHSARAWLGEPFRSDDAVIVWGGHDAYRRLDPAREVVRTVILTGHRVTVVDWVSGPDGMAWDLTVPLAPGARVSPVDGAWSLEPPGGSALTVLLPGRGRVLEGSTEPFAGWSSATYGTWQPAPWLRCTGTLDGPVVWSVALAGADAAESARDGDGAVGVPTGSGRTTLRVEWVGRVARLRVEQGDRQWVAAAGR